MNNEMMELYSPISHRIKAFMNTEIPSLREASIKLFGEICVRHKSDAIKEQALTLFPCFLLHLADDNIDVVKVILYFFNKNIKIVSNMDNLTNPHIRINLINEYNVRYYYFSILKSKIENSPRKLITINLFLF